MKDYLSKAIKLYEDQEPNKRDLEEVKEIDKFLAENPPVKEDKKK